MNDNTNNIFFYKEQIKKIENELYELRKFKLESEEMCSSHAVIDSMNRELENVRIDMNQEINKYKTISINYEDHINHIYDNLTSKIFESIETDFFNIGIYRFNLIEKINEFCDSPIMINLLKTKIIGFIKKYNINISLKYASNRVIKYKILKLKRLPHWKPLNSDTTDLIKFLIN